MDYQYPNQVISSFKKIIIFSTVFLGAISFLLFSDNGTWTGDSIPYRYLPIAILRHQTFYLDAFPQLTNPQYYAVIKGRGGHLISKKPVFPALMEIPFYMIYTAWHNHLPESELEMMQLGRLTMVVIASLAAVCLTGLLMDLNRKWLAAAAGLGLVTMTPFWFTALDCWPHPLLALFNIISIGLLGKRTGKGIWVLIGLFQGLAITVRLSALMVALAFGLVALLIESPDIKTRIRRLALMFFGGITPLLALLFYNNHHLGSPWTTGYRIELYSQIRWPLLPLAGLFISPAKGLFLFSPILVLFPLAFFLRGIKHRWEIKVSGLAIALHTIYWAFYADWWGGWAWGPRYLSEILPFACYLTALVIDEILSFSHANKWLIGGLLTTLAVFSLMFQTIGILSWDGEYHKRYDKGWGSENHWVWSAPFEPLWRLKRGIWFFRGARLKFRIPPNPVGRELSRAVFGRYDNWQTFVAKLQTK